MGRVVLLQCKYTQRHRVPGTGILTRSCGFVEAIRAPISVIAQCRNKFPLLVYDHQHNPVSFINLPMKANINTVLVGSKVILVPYRPEHVPVRVWISGQG